MRNRETRRTRRNSCPLFLSFIQLPFHALASLKKGNLFVLAVGVGRQPCAITWPGYFAFSDPEAKALADFIMENNVEKWKLYLTLHSYSQLWMTPWGYTRQLPQDYDKMVRSCIVLRGQKDVLWSLGKHFTIK